MRNITRLIGVGVAAAAITAGAIGFSANADTSDATPSAPAPVAAMPVLSVLEKPAADASISTAAPKGRPEIDPASMRVALENPDGVSVLAAKTVDGKVCIMIRSKAGTGSSCNPLDVFNSFGALPLARQDGPTTMLVSLLVDDRYTSIVLPGQIVPRAIENNATQFEASKENPGVTLLGPEGARTTIDLTPLL